MPTAWPVATFASNVDTIGRVAAPIETTTFAKSGGVAPLASGVHLCRLLFQRLPRMRMGGHSPGVIIVIVARSTRIDANKSIVGRRNMRDSDKTGLIGGQIKVSKPVAKTTTSASTRAPLAATSTPSSTDASADGSSRTRPLASAG